MALLIGQVGCTVACQQAGLKASDASLMLFILQAKAAVALKSAHVSPVTNGLTRDRFS